METFRPEALEEPQDTVVEQASLETFNRFQEQQGETELSAAERKIIELQGRVDKIATYIDFFALTSPPRSEIVAVEVDDSKWTPSAYKKISEHVQQRAYALQSTFRDRTAKLSEEIQRIMARVEADPVQHENDIARAAELLEAHLTYVHPRAAVAVAERDAFRAAEDRYASRLADRFGIGASASYEARRKELLKEIEVVGGMKGGLAFTAWRKHQLYAELRKIEPLGKVLNNIDRRRWGDQLTEWASASKQDPWYYVREDIIRPLKSSLAEEVGTIQKELPPLPALDTNMLDEGQRSHLYEALGAEFRSLIPPDAHEKDKEYAESQFQKFATGEDASPSFAWQRNLDSLDHRFFAKGGEDRANKLVLFGDDVFDGLVALSQSEDWQGVALEVVRERFQASKDAFAGEGRPGLLNRSLYSEITKERQAAPAWQAAFHMWPLRLLMTSDSGKDLIGEAGVQQLKTNAARVLSEGLLLHMNDREGETVLFDKDNELAEFLLGIPDAGTAQLIINLIRTDYGGGFTKVSRNELAVILDLATRDSPACARAGLRVFTFVEWNPAENLDLIASHLERPELKKGLIHGSIRPYGEGKAMPPKVVRFFYPHIPTIISGKNGLEPDHRFVDKLLEETLQLASNEPGFREELFEALSSQPELQAAFFEVASALPQHLAGLAQNTTPALDVLEEYRKFLAKKEGKEIEPADFKQAYQEVFSALPTWNMDNTPEFSARLALYIAHHPSLLGPFRELSDNKEYFHDAEDPNLSKVNRSILQVFMRDRFLRAENAEDISKQCKALVGLLRDQVLEPEALETLRPFMVQIRGIGGEEHLGKLRAATVGAARESEAFHQRLLLDMKANYNLSEIVYASAHKRPEEIKSLFLGGEPWKAETAEGLRKHLKRVYGADAPLEEYYSALAAYRRYDSAVESIAQHVGGIAPNELVKAMIQTPELRGEYLRMSEALLPLLKHDAWGGKVVVHTLNSFVANPGRAALALDAVTRFAGWMKEARSAAAVDPEKQAALQQYTDESLIKFVAGSPERGELIFACEKKAPLLFEESRKGLKNFVYDHGAALLKGEEDLVFINDLIGKHSKAADQIIRDYAECLEQGVITTEQKKEVNEFLEHFRILTPNIMKGYLEAKATGTTDIFLTGLKATAEKMTSGEGMLEKDRQSPYYSELLRAVYQNNAGNWTTYDRNSKCEDRNGDLGRFKIRPRYEIDLMSGGTIKLKEGATLDKGVVDALKGRVFRVAEGFKKEGFDSEKMRSRVAAEIEEGFTALAAKGAWEGLDIKAVEKPEEKLFLLLSEQIYGAGTLPAEESQDLIIKYQFAYLEDIRNYIQGTADRVNMSTAPEYAHLCELDNFFADKIKEVNRILVSDAWKNGAIAEYMPAYFRRYSERTLDRGRSQQIAKLQVGKLGMNAGFVKQLTRVLEGKTGKKYTPQQVAYIVRRYESMTEGLSREGAKNPYARNEDQAKRTKSFRGQLKGQRERTLAAVKIITGKGMAPEDIHLEEIDLEQWLSAEANLRTGEYNEEQFATYTAQQLVNMFAEERSAIEGEIAKFVSESGGTRETLHAYITKTRESAHARMVGGVCVSGDNPPAQENMWDMANYIQMAFQDPKTARCQGLNLMHVFEGSETENGERILTVSFNPSSTYLYSVDEAALFKGILAAIKTFATENNFDKILVSRNAQIRTNRTGGVFETALNKAIGEVGKQYKFNEPKQFSFNPQYKMQDMDIIWERAKS